MKIKKIIFLTLLSIIFTFLIARLAGRPFNHNIKFSIYLLYGFFGIYLIKNKSNKLINYSIFLIPNITICILIFHINDYRFYQLATPSTLSFFLGSIIGYSANKKSFYFISLIVVFFSYWVYNEGYNLWYHKLNYNSFFGVLNKPIAIKKVNLKNIDNHQMMLNKKDVYYVLDFWTSSCGVCFKEFPKYEKLYRKIQNSKTIEFYAINVPYRDEIIKQNLMLIKKHNYSFPVLFYNDDLTYLKDSLEVKAYPTSLVIKNDTLLVIGNSNSVKKYIDLVE